jgi:hypothetical protein
MGVADGTDVIANDLRLRRFSWKLPRRLRLPGVFRPERMLVMAIEGRSSSGVAREVELSRLDIQL